MCIMVGVCGEIACWGFFLSLLFFFLGLGGVVHARDLGFGGLRCQGVLGVGLSRTGRVEVGGEEKGVLPSGLMLCRLVAQTAPTAFQNEY